MGEELKVFIEDKLAFRYVGVIQLLINRLWYLRLQYLYREYAYGYNREWLHMKIPYIVSYILAKITYFI